MIRWSNSGNPVIICLKIPSLTLEPLQITQTVAYVKPAVKSLQTFNRHQQKFIFFGRQTAILMGVLSCCAPQVGFCQLPNSPDPQLPSGCIWIPLVWFLQCITSTLPPESSLSLSLQLGNWCKWSWAKLIKGYANNLLSPLALGCWPGGVAASKRRSSCKSWVRVNFLTCRHSLAAPAWTCLLVWGPHA